MCMYNMDLKVMIKNNKTRNKKNNNHKRKLQVDVMVHEFNIIIFYVYCI